MDFIRGPPLRVIPAKAGMTAYRSVGISQMTPSPLRRPRGPGLYGRNITIPQYARKSLRGDFQFLHRTGGIHSIDGSIGLALERGRIQPLKFAPPPKPRLTLGGDVSEPILPNHGPHLHRRIGSERISGKKFEHARIVLEQQHFRAHNPVVFAPTSQRRKPEVPIEARLVRRVDLRWLGRVLGLVTEGIRSPGRAIPGALEFDFEARRSHHGKESVGKIG